MAKSLYISRKLYNKLFDEREDLARQLITSRELCDRLRKDYEAAIERETDWRKANQRSQDALREMTDKYYNMQRSWEFAKSNLERALGWANAKLSRHPLDQRTDSPMYPSANPTDKDGMKW